MDIEIEKINDVYCQVKCSELSVGQELADFFTFYAPNYRFIPAFKHKQWDGKIRLYNQYNQMLYFGLIDYVKEFAKERGYELEISKTCRGSSIPPSSKHGENFLKCLKIHSGGSPIVPHQHQIEGFDYFLQNPRCLMLSPTASGKSYLIYAIARYLNNLIGDSKFLIIVPTISLVNQLYSDFEDYSSHNGFSVSDTVHKIYDGASRDTEKRIVISTWQSVHTQPKEYFSQFTGVLCDEVHTLQAKCVKSIFEKLTDCSYRIGVTGTLNDLKCSQYVLEGLTGKVHSLTTTKKLIDKNILSNLKINCITLAYEDAERKACKNLTYVEEIQFLFNHEKRNTFLVDLAKNLKGNTLVLFSQIAHGKFLQSLLEKKYPERTVMYVSGETEPEIRESIRKSTEDQENAILICSVGTFSAGVNIKRLHNIIFASPSKGRIRVLQSIGRQLRKSEHKKIAKLYDISDDLSYKSHHNYSLKHQYERIKIYISENFDYSTVKVKL